MCFIRERNAQDLENLIDAAFQFHIMLNNRNKAVSDYGTVYLEANGIFSLSPKALYLEMLFYPFEK